MVWVVVEMMMMNIVASATVLCFVQGWVVLSDGLSLFFL
jgi:hypothetical protein